MWRKLLILCMVIAGSATSVAGASAGPAVKSADLASASSLIGTAGGNTARSVALVIGNQRYADAPLSNAENDARAMSALLGQLGYTVILEENLGASAMVAAIARFKEALAAGGGGVFYFAGHGLQVAGKTLLLPLDADSRIPSSLLTKAIELDAVLAAMPAPGAGRGNVVILDTCLNNPFLSPFAALPIDARPSAHIPSSGTGALRRKQLPDRTDVAFATAPGALASDGNGGHGSFTSALLKTMATPGVAPREALVRAALEVRGASLGRQLPWVDSSWPQGGQAGLPLAGMSPPMMSAQSGHDDVKGAAPSRGVMPKDSAEQVEMTFWDSVKNSEQAGDYEAYLQAYPNGRFAALAKARLNRLRAAAPKTEPVTPKAEPASAAKPTPEPKRAAPARPEPRKAPAASAPAPAPAASAPAPTAPAATDEKPPPLPASARGEIKDCPTCPVLIGIPAGSFTMGSNSSDPSEKPAHHVTLQKPFAIGKYEVTVDQWNACVAGGACPRTGETNRPGNTPVRDVSWDEAQLYLKWLGTAGGQVYRLPTEAEWEFAARGGSATRFWWGDQMQKGKANCKECGEPWQDSGPNPVGSFAPNQFGLHDMNGSVWEWVQDCWHNTYKGAPVNGHAWEEANCRVRVIRGASWRDGASYMPSTTRFKYDAAVRQSQNGFRVARDVK
ncbi:MAG: serine/threonine protein kinase [Herminiimonas sp.]|nr:serine/threonine protein kinase [Herminiimonas sp.]